MAVQCGRGPSVRVEIRAVGAGESCRQTGRPSCPGSVTMEIPHEWSRNMRTNSIRSTECSSSNEYYQERPRHCAVSSRLLPFCLEFHSLVVARTYLWGATGPQISYEKGAKGAICTGKAAPNFNKQPGQSLALGAELVMGALGTGKKTGKGKHEMNGSFSAEAR